MFDGPSNDAEASTSRQHEQDHRSENGESDEDDPVAYNAKDRAVLSSDPLDGTDVMCVYSRISYKTNVLRVVLEHRSNESRKLPLQASPCLDS